MTSPFDAAFAVVVGVEGGFVDDPADPGGATKYGISARAYPALDIPNLTLAQARAIYLADYWMPVRGDALPAGVALLVFDAAVNQGVGTGARFLQAACGAVPDGIIGPRTLALVNLANRRALVLEIAARRAVAYAGDAPEDRLGWYRRLMTVAAAALGAAS